MDGNSEYIDSIDSVDRKMQLDVNGNKMTRKPSLNSAGAAWEGITMSDAKIKWDKLKRKTTERVRLMKGKFLCVVTGAGHGLGRSIAGLVFQDQGIFSLAFSGSKVILADCDMDALKETSGKKMRQFLKHRKIDVALECVDFSDLEATKAFVTNIAANNDKDFEHVIVVNNTSTVGDISQPLIHKDDVDEFADYWKLNITSRVILTTQFCKAFPHSKKTVVHTLRYESACATPHLGFSNMASGAFEMFAETFAKENPKVRLLQFTPKRLDTSRAKILSECPNLDLADVFKEAIESKSLEKPLDAAKRMARILDECTFHPGEVLKMTEDNDIEYNGV